ncbi:MAG: DctP family TRAP transporter solute-binding subunit [Rhodospirillales bacterium]|nr:DctP family TRAP transporter solute-binding subunit [Rhodospirillales bacterium]
MRIFLALVLAFLPLLTAQAADPKILYLAHLNKNDQADNPTAAMAVAFKRELEARSAGAIRVEIFPEGQLGGDAQVVGLVQKGVIQSAISSVGGMAKIYPLIGVLDFPFAFRDLKETYALFDGPFGQKFGADIAAKSGLRVLGFGDTGGFFIVTNSKRPVRAPDDMKGLRLRVMGVDSHKSFVKSLGAEPVGIAWNELYAALRGGLADGQMNPVSIVRFGKLDEVQKFATITNHIYTPYVWTANEAFLQSLSDDERRFVSEAARKGIEASRALASATHESALSAMKARMNVFQPSDKEIEAFRKIAQPAMAQLIGEKLDAEGLSWLAEFEQAVKDAQKKK